MTRLRLSLVLAFLVLVLAPPAAPADPAGPNPVIGGGNAPPNKWPDIVGVQFDYGGGQFSIDCTGTLIAPDVVLTAGHCNDASLTQVVIGSSSRTRLTEGEVVEVSERFEYPNSQGSFDITALKLARASIKEPRVIASGWARHDIQNGAEVALVGFGTVDRNGSQVVDPLQEALSTVTDADCTTSSGCNAAARPAGEVGAGGGGIDTCPGDSGGPMYLVTDYGTFLAGVTSRGYNDNQFWCSEGGIYARPDAIVEWIEDTTGVVLPKAPGPSAELLVAPGGDGVTTVEPNDPRAGTTHTFAIVGPAAHGLAEIDADGVVVYQAVDGYLGPDSFTVAVADAAEPTRSVELEVEVDVVEDTGGCCQTGRTGGAAPLLLVGLVALGLRRRKR